MLGLSVTVNHKQKRILRRRQWVVASGVDFTGDEDLYAFSNVWIDPITHRLQLRPGPKQDAWWTSNSGIYAKLAKADFTGTTANCQDTEDIPDAGYFQFGQDADTPVLTSATFAKNTGMWAAFFVDSSGDRAEVGRGGWSNAGAITSGVGWILYSDGSFELYKDGVFLASYKVSGAKGSPGSGGASIQNKRVGMMMIPVAGRELLVISTEGDGFCHVFGDIEEGDPNPVILPPGKMWIQVHNASTHFQLAKIQWPTSGYTVTRALSFPEDPTGLPDPYGRFFYGFTDGPKTLHAAPDFQLYNWAHTGPFPPVGTLPDGSPDLRCRIQVNLSGDGSYSPVVYGCVAIFDPLTCWTNDSEAVCIDSHILEWSAELCEDRAGRQWVLELKEPEALMALHALAGNLPVRIKFSESNSTAVDDGDIVVVDGYSEEPVWYVSLDDGLQRCRWVIREPWGELEHTESQDIYPHDDTELSQALRFDLADAAIGLKGPGETQAQADADLDLDTTALTLGGIPSRDANDWSVLRDVGASAAADLRELLDDNAATWLAGFQPRKNTAAAPVPRPPFILWAPATVNAKAPLELFLERAGAVAAGSEDYTVWEMQRSRLLPEACDVRITWRDPRTGKIHQERKIDEDAQDPTLAPSARPDNWLGSNRLAGLATDKITTAEVAADALDYYFDRLTASPEIGEIRSEMIFWPEDGPNKGRPLWVGDRVTIEGVTYKVCAMHLRGFKEPHEDEATPVKAREASYVLGDGSGNTSGGSRLRDILEANRLRAAKGEKLWVRPRMRDLIRQTPTLIVIHS